MKKWIGWIGFFLVVLVLAVGGFFLLPLFQGDTFSFKEVEILDYDDYTLNDLVEQDVICNDKGCKFKDKDVVYTISEVKTLGKQDVNVKIEYEGEAFEKTFRVNVVDRVAPEISLSETALVVDKNEKIDPNSYITSVKDNYDELNVEDIVVLNNVDLATPGDYEVIYTIKDSSDNEGKAILKVKVKGDRETVTSNDNKTDVKVEDSKITLDFSVSGLFNETGTLIEGKTSTASNKNIELGWDTTLKVTSKIDMSGRIRYIISKNEITGDELSPIGGRGFPVIGGDEVTANKSSDFEYTFTDAGTYYFSIVVFDQDNEIAVKKDFVLNLTISSEVKDMKILTEDKGSYISIDCDYIGGGNNSYYFVAALTDSDDPKALEEEEIIVTENNEIKLYYTSGYYYDVAGMLFTEDGDLVKMETLKIQK